MREQSYKLIWQSHMYSYKLNSFFLKFPFKIKQSQTLPISKWHFWAGYHLSPQQTSKNLEIFHYSTRKLWAISFLNFSSKTIHNSSSQLASYSLTLRTSLALQPSLLQAPGFFVDWYNWKHSAKTKDVQTFSSRGKPAPRINFWIFVDMKWNSLCEKSMPNQMLLQT